MGQPSFYHATVALYLQIEICNLDRTKSSFLATSSYEKVIFEKNLSYKVFQHPTDVHVYARSFADFGSHGPPPILFMFDTMKALEIKSILRLYE